MTLYTSKGLLEPRQAMKLNEENLLAYLKANVQGFPSSLRAFTVKQFPYGQSNPTYMVQVTAHDSSDKAFVLRKKPPGELLASAHAVEREYKVLKALGSVVAPDGSRVPVPRVISLCTDSSVVGTPFYLMEHVDGRVFKDINLPELSPAERRQVYLSLGATLAAMHSVDPATCGLQTYGKPTGYGERTLKRWKGQYDKSAVGEARTPAMAELAEWLAAHVPGEPSHTAVVHGDFKLDNVVFHPSQPRAVAILDWELSTLGDPLADLAYACMPFYFSVQFPYPGFPQGPAGLLLPPGIPTEREFITAYCEKRGVAFPRAEEWAFYQGLALFRAASICAGVYARAKQGNASNSNAVLAGPVVDQLAKRALVLVRGVAVPAAPPSSTGLGMSAAGDGLMAKLVKFMEQEVYPLEAEIGRHEAGPDRWTVIHPKKEELKRRARSIGLWNLWISKNLKGQVLGYGEGFEDALLGPGLTNLDYAHLCEVTGRSHIGPECFNCSAPDTGNMEVLARYGDAAQRAKWLRPLLEGTIRSCFGMTEPAVASSDATNIQSDIRREGTDYVINGVKWWTSGARDPRCKICIFMGKTDTSAPVHQQQSMVLVPMDAPGVTIEEDLTVFGYDDAPHGHARVAFVDVRVPVTSVVLGEGRGFEIAQGRLGPGRLHHCMRCIGAAERGMQAAVARAASRRSFNKLLIQHGSLQEKMAECRILIEQSRMLVLNAARIVDEQGNKAARRAIAMAKVSAPRTTLHVLDWAIQVHGGAGVSGEFPVAYFFSAVRTLRIADGPDEVHLRDIARMEARAHGHRARL